MRRTLLIVIFLSAFSWVIYDFVATKNTDNSNVILKADPKKARDVEINDSVGVELGNLAPNFQLETLTGEIVRLSDFRGSGSC